MIAKLFMMAAGVFSICGAAFDWDWFFNNYRAKPIVKLFGREGARTFYIVIGIFIIIVSLFV